MSAVLSQVGPVGSGADWLVSWLLDNGGGAFALIRQLVDGLQQGVNGVLAAPPPWLFAVAVAAFGLWRISGGFALFCLLGLNLVLWMGLWSPMLATLALVISASLLALALGLGLGLGLSEIEVC